MKTIQSSILFIVMFVLIAVLLAQATVSNSKKLGGICIQEAFPEGKITDRHAFFVGALYAQHEIRKMRYKEELDTAGERKNILAGIEGVNIVVEDVNPEVEKYGLTQKLLQADIELRLRQYGIRIFKDKNVDSMLARDPVEQDKKWDESLLPKYHSIEESFAPKHSDEHFLQCLKKVIEHFEQLEVSPSPSQLSLCVNVNTIVLEESHYATFSVDVRLNEGAQVFRNRAFYFVPIWEKGSLAVCSSIDLRDNVRECLRGSVDEFINAYLAANPKGRLLEEIP